MDGYLARAQANDSLTTDERIGMELVAGINRIADAIVLLARATAGELEDGYIPQAGSLSEAG